MVDAKTVLATLERQVLALPELHVLVELRKQRATLSSVTLTCYGGVASNLPQRALQALTQQGISADKFILSPNSISFVVSPETREAAVKALHSLI